MDRNSNTYTFLYAAAMVVLVAALLASVAMALRPLQKKNVEIEKMQNILSAVNIQSTTENAGEIYEERIQKQYVVNADGEMVEGVDAFTVDLKKEQAKPLEEQ